MSLCMQSSSKEEQRLGLVTGLQPQNLEGWGKDIESSRSACAVGTGLLRQRGEEEARVLLKRQEERHQNQLWGEHREWGSTLERGQLWGGVSYGERKSSLGRGQLWRWGQLCRECQSWGSGSTLGGSAMELGLAMQRDPVLGKRGQLWGRESALGRGVSSRKSNICFTWFCLQCISRVPRKQLHDLILLFSTRRHSSESQQS